MKKKFQKNNSAQVGQNFQNQLPDNLSGRKTQPPTKLVGSPKSNFCPTWAEVKNHFAVTCGEVKIATSTQVVSKLNIRKRRKALTASVSAFCELCLLVTVFRKRFPSVDQPEILFKECFQFFNNCLLLFIT